MPRRVKSKADMYQVIFSKYNQPLVLPSDPPMIADQSSHNRTIVAASSPHERTVAGQQYVAPISSIDDAKDSKRINQTSISSYQLSLKNETAEESWGYRMRHKIKLQRRATVEDEKNKFETEEDELVNHHDDPGFVVTTNWFKSSWRKLKQLANKIARSEGDTDSSSDESISYEKQKISNTGQQRSFDSRGTRRPDSTWNNFEEHFVSHENLAFSEGVEVNKESQKREKYRRIEPLVKAHMILNSNCIYKNPLTPAVSSHGSIQNQIENVPSEGTADTNSASQTREPMLHMETYQTEMQKAQIKVDRLLETFRGTENEINEKASYTKELLEIKEVRTLEEYTEQLKVKKVLSEGKTDTKCAGRIAVTKTTVQITDIKSASQIAGTKTEGQIRDTKPAGQIADTKTTGQITNTKIVSQITGTTTAGQITDTKLAGQIADRELWRKEKQDQKFEACRATKHMVQLKNILSHVILVDDITDTTDKTLEKLIEIYILSEEVRRKFINRSKSIHPKDSLGFFKLLVDITTTSDKTGEEPIEVKNAAAEKRSKQESTMIKLYRKVIRNETCRMMTNIDMVVSEAKHLFGLERTQIFFDLLDDKLFHFGPAGDISDFVPNMAESIVRQNVISFFEHSHDVMNRLMTLLLGCPDSKRFQQISEKSFISLIQSVIDSSLKTKTKGGKKLSSEESTFIMVDSKEFERALGEEILEEVLDRLRRGDEVIAQILVDTRLEGTQTSERREKRIIYFPSCCRLFIYIPTEKGSYWHQMDMQRASRIRRHYKLLF